MGTIQDKISKIRSISDQCWAGLSEYEYDINRIAELGPDGSEYDILLCRKMAYTIAGDIILRREEAENI